MSTTFKSLFNNAYFRLLDDDTDSVWLKTWKYRDCEHNACQITTGHCYQLEDDLPVCEIEVEFRVKPIGSSSQQLHRSSDTCNAPRNDNANLTLPAENINDADCKSFSHSIFERYLHHNLRLMHANLTESQNRRESDRASELSHLILAKLEELKQGHETSAETLRRLATSCLRPEDAAALVSQYIVDLVDLNRMSELNALHELTVLARSNRQCLRAAIDAAIAIGKILAIRPSKGTADETRDISYIALNPNAKAAIVASFNSRFSRLREELFDTLTSYLTNDASTIETIKEWFSMHLYCFETTLRSGIGSLFSPLIGRTYTSTLR